MSDLTKPQPPPIANDLPASWDLVVDDIEAMFPEDDALAAVIADMRSRDKFGFDKYGVRIQPRNGRDNLVDAYQEILDGAVYFRSAVYEAAEEDDGRSAQDLEALYLQTLTLLMRLRKAIWKRDGQ